MRIKVGINGFGRIGRNILRAALNENIQVDFVAVNDIATAENLAYLLKYDSIHGRFNKKVETNTNALIVNGKEIKVLSEKDPTNLPWKELGVEVVIESTGKFTEAKEARKHLDAGAKKVIITAPAKEEDITIVLGVNDGCYDKNKHHIISNASCTTNCLAPIVKIIHKHFGIEKGLMTTIHAYTADQSIMDSPKQKDFRRGRSATLSIVPSSTGAAKAIGLVIPELKGKLNGLAMRVPVPNVSVVDLVAILSKSTTVEEINEVVKIASEGEMNKYIAYCEEPTVSVDYNGSAYSAIFVPSETMMVDKNMVKVIAWYDNEWAYSCRTAELIEFIMK